MKESIVYYRSFYESLRNLPLEVRAEVQEAIFQYSFEGTIPELSVYAEAIFTLIKPQLDANDQRYINSKKGGAPRGNKNAEKAPAPQKEGAKQPDENKQPMVDLQNNSKQPMVNFENNQKQPNVNDNVNVNVNDNVNINVNENDMDDTDTVPDETTSGEKEREIPSTPTVDDVISAYAKGDKNIRKALMGYVNMRRERNIGPTPTELKFILENLDNIAKNNKEKADIIQKSVRNRWKDFYPINQSNAEKTIKSTQKRYSFTEIDSHEYSPEELEALLSSDVELTGLQAKG